MGNLIDASLAFGNPLESPENLAENDDEVAARGTLLQAGCVFERQPSRYPVRRIKAAHLPADEIDTLKAWTPPQTEIERRLDALARDVGADRFREWLDNFADAGPAGGYLPPVDDELDGYPREIFEVIPGPAPRLEGAFPPPPACGWMYAERAPQDGGSAKVVGDDHGGGGGRTWPDAAGIAGTLGGYRGHPTPDGWHNCRCPAHDDHTPSLGLKDADDGGVIYSCWRCKLEGKEGKRRLHEKLVALGLIPPRGKGRPKSKDDEAVEEGYYANWEPVLPVPDGTIGPDFNYIKKRAPDYLWTYRDADGGLLLYEMRFDVEDGKKEYYSLTRWRSKYDHEMQGWRIKDLPAPRPLYGLDGLAMRPADPVIICEGAKSADAAGAIFPDHVAMSSIKGATAPEKSDWSPLAGCKVIIWPDHDAPGLTYAKTVARLLAEVDAESIRIVAVPDGLPEKWDLADAVPEGVDVDLRALLDGAEIADITPEDAGDGVRFKWLRVRAEWRAI